MSYRCELCEAVHPPGQARLTHAERRADGQVEREYKVCARCYQQLRRGNTPAELRRLLGPKPRPLPAGNPGDAPLGNDCVGKPVDLGGLEED